MMRTPSFWYRKKNTPIALALLPLGWVMLAVAWVRRAFITPKNTPIRLICVGNITMGGTGKTPLIMALAAAAKAKGFKPVALLRGYGGTARTPTLVDGTMGADAIGDEALMLYQILPVVVAKNRKAGVAFIEKNKLGTLILMDDGMQNPHIKKDVTIAVFNGRLGVGNGLPMPAGPLREGLSGLGRVDGIAITGEDKTGLISQIKNRFPTMLICPIERKLNADDLRAIGTRSVVAFAGIGDPDGFFMMLEGSGVNLAHTVAYPDHQPITDAMLAHLHHLASTHNAVLATTHKDFVRLGVRGAGITPIGLETVIPDSLTQRVFGQG